MRPIMRVMTDPKTWRRYAHSGTNDIEMLGRAYDDDLGHWEMTLTHPGLPTSTLPYDYIGARLGAPS